MKVAILVSDASFINSLENVINEQGWDIEFYTSSSEFSLADLTSMNVILADQEIDGMTGQDLLKSIYNKTRADLYLMNSDLEGFYEHDTKNDYIKGFIHKDIESIIAKLQYIEAKIKIINLTAISSHKLKVILAKANGYSFNINNDIAYIELRTFLSDESKVHLLDKIKNAGINKAIISYPGQKELSSIHYEQLLEICNFFHRNNKYIAFWNVENKACIDATLDGCKLNRIIPAFNNSKEAAGYLNSK